MVTQSSIRKSRIEVEHDGSGTVAGRVRRIVSNSLLMLRWDLWNGLRGEGWDVLGLLTGPIPQFSTGHE